MVYKRQLFFQYSRPSGCDTSKLLSDDLKNKLYYNGFQKMLYHYSHQEKPVHIVYWFFFFVCAMERAQTGRRRIAPQAISPVGCCLARGFQRVGMSTVEAVNRKISWLFCFCGRGCTHLHTFCTLYKKTMNSLHRLHSVYFAAQKLSLSGRGPSILLTQDRFVA